MCFYKVSIAPLVSGNHTRNLGFFVTCVVGQLAKGSVLILLKNECETGVGQFEQKHISIYHNRGAIRGSSYFTLGASVQR